MKRVNQTIIDKGHGNCLQAAIASLLNMELEKVPHFIESGDQWYNNMIEFLEEEGYSVGKTLYNVNFQRIIQHNNDDCFQETKFEKKLALTKTNLKKHGGIDGFFYAGVISPKYGTIENKWYNQHAVIIDSDLNIVHDPNPQYVNLIKYPLADVIKCNGVVDVLLIKKK